jgi:hypothetical protein
MPVEYDDTQLYGSFYDNEITPDEFERNSKIPGWLAWYNEYLQLNEQFDFWLRDYGGRSNPKERARELREEAATCGSAARRQVLELEAAELEQKAASWDKLMKERHTAIQKHLRKRPLATGRLPDDYDLQSPVPAQYVTADRKRRGVKKKRREGTFELERIQRPYKVPPGTPMTWKSTSNPAVRTGSRDRSAPARKGGDPVKK